LAEPGGDLLLRRAAQGSRAQRLHPPRRSQGPARAFEDRYNVTAQPFQWKFTTTDLDDLLAGLDRHTVDHRQESSVAPAA
jgi:hypothetical protein